MISAALLLLRQQLLLLLLLSPPLPPLSAAPAEELGAGSCSSDHSAKVGSERQHRGLRPSGNATAAGEQRPAASFAECAAVCCRLAGCHSLQFYGQSCRPLRCASADACRPARDATDGGAAYALMRSFCLAPADCPGGPAVAFCFADACQLRRGCRRDGDCGGGESCSAGACRCGRGRRRDGLRTCRQDNATAAATPRLVVVGGNATLRLPNDTVTLTASLVPPGNGSTSYTWRKVRGPSAGRLTVAGGSAEFSGLSAGEYRLRVSAVADETSPPSVIAEAETSVLVLPELPAVGRRPPTAVLRPRSQTVRRPVGVVLYAGDSRPGGGGVGLATFAWQLASGPQAAAAQLPNGTRAKQLQLRLPPGYYVLRLVVTDAGGLSDTAEANVTVLPEQDAPPKADAGRDLVVYLPQAYALLNANASSDDRGIVAFEWQQLPVHGSSRSVDIQGVHTSALRLSGLVEGEYRFRVTVKDTSNQTNSAEVRVYVKRRASNRPPTVSIRPDGVNVTLDRLREVQLTADGLDDAGIVSWNWTVDPANGMRLLNRTLRVVTVTALRAGTFTVTAEATDTDGAVGRGSATVVSRRRPNSAPVARVAGGAHQEVQLDAAGLSVVSLDGSQSSDDKGIVSYRWHLEANESLAAGGRALGDSATRPVLLLADLLPGSYRWTLSVTDAENESGAASVRLVAKAWPHDGSVAELRLLADASNFTEKEAELARKQLRLLLRHDSVDFLGLSASAGGVTLRLAARPSSSSSSADDYVSGRQLARRLGSQLANGRLLDWPVLLLRSSTCQLSCSGRGACNVATFACDCPPMWLSSPLADESNCDLSAPLLAAAVAVLLATVVACVRRCRRRRRRPTHAARRRRRRLSSSDAAAPYDSEETVAFAFSDEELELTRRVQPTTDDSQQQQQQQQQQQPKRKQQQQQPPTTGSATKNK